MTKYGSADIGFLLIDGLNILGEATQIEETREAVTEDVTAFGDDWAVQAVVGVKGVDLTQDGYYDDAVGSVHEAFAENEGVERVLNYALTGNVSGAEMVGFAGALQVNYRRLAAIKGLHRSNVRYLGNGPIDIGKIIAPLAPSTTDDDTTGDAIDNLAESLAGGTAYLQVAGLNLDGGTKVVVEVLDSANGVDFAEVATFDDVVAIGAEALPIVGTIRRHAAARWTWTGGGAGKTITIMVGLRRY